MTEINRSNYTEETIKSMDWREHIRSRPGMYIGKLGDGASHDDGIYVLIKEVVDNSVDEYAAGFGKKIEITIKDKQVVVRDYGRGIPLGSVIECVSQINTGGKLYENEAFTKSVGLNGVGLKAVNALSSNFVTQSIRNNRTVIVEYSQGNFVSNSGEIDCNEKDGTIVTFTPDEEIFGNYHFYKEYVDKMLWNYCYLNNNLTINLNGETLQAKNGLLDMLSNNLDENKIVYPIIHITDNDFECALTHTNKYYGEEYFSFVNGQYTTQGGTHLTAFREIYVRTIKEFYNKDFDPADIRSGIVAAVSIKVKSPIFESQTKTKLGSTHIAEGGVTIYKFISDILKKKLDDYLHINPDVAELLLNKILQSEKERKEITNYKKLARESVKKTSLHNKKLRDCRVHYNSDDELRDESTLFITEGDSASGSITKSRDVNTQAVFSLRGKPLNSYGKTKKIVYENDEFNLLQAAINVEDGIENLRYNKIVIATDADVDGMHIRLLLLTFFLQFYPELVKNGHVYILQTPLYRVRNKKETIYCYDEDQKVEALDKLKPNPEITRFKGLGEISPEEFGHFIGKNIRLEPVILKNTSEIDKVLEYYMGNNTPSRQNFIIENLRYEEAEIGVA
ncbi:MAG: toprim domain-containing protein [Lentimicrobiaceae bacterium]|nr:toprim domain-containing protein [Lentimicrobiaceae bacterium]